MMFEVLAAAPVHQAHQGSAAAGGITLSVALVAGLIGYFAATRGRHWALAAVCWITVGATSVIATPIAGLVTSVIAGIGHALSGAGG